MPLAPGDRFGRYEIVQLLGKGGMGEVYRAQDSLLRRRVALKVLRTRSSEQRDPKSGSDGAARILREARAAAGIEHPNAIAIYDVGEVDGVAFLAMEFVAGQTLRPAVGDPSVSFGRRVRWLVDVARALGAAHQLGLVHRDIKPENVMVRDDGTVKVLDFGIARRVAAAADPNANTDVAGGTLTAEGVIVGTPFYMAPEQMRGEPLDGRADQFAWGVLAYELLTGRRPWSGGTDGLQLVAQILSSGFAPPRDKNPEIPPAVDGAIRRAMEKSAADRFPDMEAIAEILEPHASPAGPGTARSQPTASRPPPHSAMDAAIVPATRADTANAPSTRTELARGDDASSALPSVERKARGAHSTRRLLAVLAAVVSVVAGVLAVGRARTHGADGGPRADRAEAAIAVTAGFPDYGSEMSRNAEAVAAYRKGMQAARDADTGTAFTELGRAASLDPEFAAAFLRRGLVFADLQEADRMDLQAAIRLRAHLGEHDQQLLDAFGPRSIVPDDTAEAARRLDRLRQTHPQDADYALQDCRSKSFIGAYHEALDVCARARELDTKSAALVEEEAIVRGRLGDAAGAREGFQACVRASPVASSCLDWLARLDGHEGRCEDALADVRRAISLRSGDMVAQDFLPAFLLAAGEPVSGARLALDLDIAQAPPAEAPARKARAAALLATFTGDFSEAERQFGLWDAEIAAIADEGRHLNVAVPRLQLAEEEGKSAAAIAIANDYLQDRAIWTPSVDDDFSMFFIGELYRLGALKRRAFVEKRDRWLLAKKALPAGNLYGSTPGFAWISAYAGPAVTRADAEEALAVLPRYLPLPDPLTRKPEFVLPTGNAYLLAGKPEEAIKYLSIAARSCWVLESIDEIMTANLALGRASEQLGDKAGACAAYGVVVRRWGNASPPSITATRARERMRALDCQL